RMREGPQLRRFAGVLRLLVLLFQFFAFPQLPTGTIHPPPKSNPGAKEAKNTALRSLAFCPAALSNAECSVAPHIEDPRFPFVAAIGGNALHATPSCFASSATSRGFGWCVANAPTLSRGIPLRRSTSLSTRSMR